MPQITPFTFDSQQIRVQVDGQGNPWFVAADVCSVLEIKDASDTVSRLDEDEKGTATTGTLGGNQKMLTVSESGLYALIFTSRKPDARRFRKWVTSEVLPAIRKTGSYSRGSVKQSTPTGRPANRVEDLLNRIDEDVFFGLFREK